MGSKSSRIAPIAAATLANRVPDTSYWEGRPYQQTKHGLRLHYPEFIVGAVPTSDFPDFRINDCLDPTNNRFIVLYDSMTGRTTQILRA
jgi:hypothetical protein